MTRFQRDNGDIRNDANPGLRTNIFIIAKHSFSTRSCRVSSSICDLKR
jgi:hypothetical protein